MNVSMDASTEFEELYGGGHLSADAVVDVYVFAISFQTCRVSTAVFFNVILSKFSVFAVRGYPRTPMGT